MVHPRRPGPRRVKLWLSGVIVVLAAAAIGYYLHSARQPRAGAGGGGLAAVRTVPVTVGDLQETIRLTGVVQAERSVALLAPRLRGSRSDRIRTGGNADYSASTPMSSAGGAPDDAPNSTHSPRGERQSSDPGNVSLPTPS